jgi:hypothetical protein
VPHGDDVVFSTDAQGGPQSQPDPASESDQHFGRFAEAKIVAPAPNEIMAEEAAN